LLQILLQSYDIFSKVVSIAHGKSSKGIKTENAKNQSVTKNRAPYPMENYSQGYGNYKSHVS
jgi:hypothetical protein